MKTIITTLIVSFALAFILGILLGIFKKIFYIPVDEKIAKIREVLPGANCGACGYPGCDSFAAAVAAGEAPANGCLSGGPSVAKKVGEVLGVKTDAVKNVAVRTCQGGNTIAKDKGSYIGIKSCSAAKTLGINGTKLCSFGCMGFGDCVAACNFDALHMGKEGLPIVNYDACTGCGMCVTACPQGIMTLVPADRKGSIALCSNRNPVKSAVFKQCKSACIKCGKCERTCKYDAIHVIDGIPLIQYDKCTSCNECVEACPTKVLKLVENIVQVSI
ncbi:MAG: ferredoxin [Treponema sp. CETP13]|nr:MAG: ferredoxin [Treponema sp. CETP13]